MKRMPNGTCRPQPPVFDAAVEKALDDAASDNLLKLNIYFGSKSVTSVTEIATYSGVSTISSFENISGDKNFSFLRFSAPISCLRWAGQCHCCWGSPSS